MKKRGKYEKTPQEKAAAGAKKTILQTYVTSLISLMLCVTMFFGTSFAWFTSEVTNEANEIYIGTLDVGLLKETDAGTVSLAGTSEKLFNGSIRWEPGYTSLETVQVVNEGDLAFNYALMFTEGKLDEAADSTQSLENVAKFFEVWVYDHKEGAEAPAPKSYGEITAPESGWYNAGTLDDLLAGGTVLTGTMEDVRHSEAALADATAPTVVPNDGTTDGKNTVRTHTIALHMSEAADASVMGYKISLNVKLVAYQLAAEQDDLGTGYDQGITVVSTEEQLVAALEMGGKILFAEDIELQKEVTLAKDTFIDLNGYVLTSNAVTIDAEHVHVSNGDWMLNPEAGAPPVIVKSSLELSDVDVSCEKMFYTSNGYGEAVAISVEGGKLVMEDSCIACESNGGTQYSYAYCVVLMNNATFEMKGGMLSASEPTGNGEAGESSFAVFANGGGEMNASLENVEISSAHYVAGANGATLKITLKNVSYNDAVTEKQYIYENGQCVITEE